MSEHRVPFVERIVRRVEDNVEQWREQDAARKAEAEANRQRLWAEAAERETLMASAIREEVAGRGGSVEKIMKERLVVFVVHSEEAGRALDGFADGKYLLARMIPGKGRHGDGAEPMGSWLVFEPSE